MLPQLAISGLAHALRCFGTSQHTWAFVIRLELAVVSLVFRDGVIHADSNPRWQPLEVARPCSPHTGQATTQGKPLDQMHPGGYKFGNGHAPPDPMSSLSNYGLQTFQYSDLQIEGHTVARGRYSTCFKVCACACSRTKSAVPSLPMQTVTLCKRGITTLQSGREQGCPRSYECWCQQPDRF